MTEKNPKFKIGDMVFWVSEANDAIYKEKISIIKKSDCGEDMIYFYGHNTPCGFPIALLNFSEAQAKLAEMAEELKK